MQQVAIHRIESNLFFIVAWEDDSFKWDGRSFRRLGYSYESAKSFALAEEVVAACKGYGFTIEALFTGLPRKEEGKVWDKLQALLEA